MSHFLQFLQIFPNYPKLAYYLIIDIMLNNGFLSIPLSLFLHQNMFIAITAQASASAKALWWFFLMS